MLTEIIREDAPGSSTSPMTRLEAEVACNSAKPDHAPVTDSSLTHGDLRKNLNVFKKFGAGAKKDAGEAAEAVGNVIGESMFGGER
jgi:hypothetical protein